MDPDYEIYQSVNDYVLPPKIGKTRGSEMSKSYLCIGGPLDGKMYARFQGDSFKVEIIPPLWYDLKPDTIV